MTLNTVFQCGWLFFKNMTGIENEKSLREERLKLIFSICCFCFWEAWVRQDWGRRPQGQSKFHRSILRHASVTAQRFTALWECGEMNHKLKEAIHLENPPTKRNKTKNQTTKNVILSWEHVLQIYCKRHEGMRSLSLYTLKTAGFIW